MSGVTARIASHPQFAFGSSTLGIEWLDQPRSTTCSSQPSFAMFPIP